MSARGRFSIETVSPGHSVGSMLVPETCSRQRPCWRSRSRVNSCFRPRSAIFISNLGVLPRAKMALPFHPADFTAGQRHRLEYPFVAKRRLPIWFFGTTESSGYGRFGTRPVLNLHGPSRSETAPCPPLPCRGRCLKIVHRFRRVWSFPGPHERGKNTYLGTYLVR